MLVRVSDVWTFLLAIAEESINHLIRIYPNPSNGVFKIDMADSNFRTVTYSLYNPQGQQIIQSANLKTQQHWLEYSHLTNGVYYIKISFDNQILRKKLVVVR